MIPMVRTMQTDTRLAVHFEGLCNLDVCPFQKGLV